MLIWFDGPGFLPHTAAIFNITGATISIIGINKKSKFQRKDNKNSDIPAIDIGERKHKTSEKIKNVAIQVLLVLSWLLLSFILHLAVLDLFETNGWYLYVIAIVCAGLKILIMLKYRKISNSRIFLWVCLFLYILGVVWILVNLWITHYFGIMTTGATLNIFSVVFSIILINKHKTGDGLREP